LPADTSLKHVIFFGKGNLESVS